MKKSLLWIIGICLAAVLLWRNAHPTYYWTQRETIKVEISGKVYTGSGIVECSVQIMPQILPESGTLKYSKRGEATVVELPDGRYLFGLITGACGLPFALFKDKYDSSAANQVLSGLHVIPNLREVREVPLDNPNLHPMLVMFDDISDPSTIKQITVESVSEYVGAKEVIVNISVEMNPEYMYTGKIDILFIYINGLGIFRPAATRAARHSPSAMRNGPGILKSDRN